MSNKKKKNSNNKQAVKAKAGAPRTTMKAQQKQVQKAPKKKRAGLGEYLRGVKLEMKKVVWPTKKELTSYTIVVVAVCVFFALLFWAIDTGFMAILQKMLGIRM